MYGVSSESVVPSESSFQVCMVFQVSVYGVPSESVVPSVYGVPSESVVLSESGVPSLFCVLSFCSSKRFGSVIIPQCQCLIPCFENDIVEYKD